MLTDSFFDPFAQSSGQPKHMFQAGDLVRPRTDHTMLCEVLGAEDEHRIRVRGLEWAPGYSAIVPAQEIYLVSRGAA